MNIGYRALTGGATICALALAGLGFSNSDQPSACATFTSDSEPSEITRLSFLESTYLYPVGGSEECVEFEIGGLVDAAWADGKPPHQGATLVTLTVNGVTRVGVRQTVPAVVQLTRIGDNDRA